MSGNKRGVQTTTYIGGIYEQVRHGQRTEHRHYISAGGEVIAVDSVYQQAGAGHPESESHGQAQFLHHDHLGSVDVITKDNKIITEVVKGESAYNRLSFDAFGQRRQANWRPSATVISASVIRRFSGHEQLDSVGLIHMNGRVYDPRLGRFLSADPSVRQAQDCQSLNRYSYARTNPLSYVDPSGFFIKKLKKVCKKVRRVVSRALRQVSRSVASIAGRSLDLINSNVLTGMAAQVWACSVGGAYGCALYAGASRPMRDVRRSGAMRGYWPGGMHA